MFKESSLYQLLNYAVELKPKIYRSSLYTVLNKLFDIAPEILIGMAIDVVVSKETSFLSSWGVTDPWEQILCLSVFTFLIWVGESTFEYLYSINWRTIAQTMQHRLRLDTYNHIQNLDLAYFEDVSTGNLTSIVNDDVNQLEIFLNSGATQLIHTFTAIVAVGGVFFYISPLIACISFLPIPIIIMGAFYYQKRSQPVYKEVREKVGAISGQLNNNISGIMTIKSFTTEDFESSRLSLHSKDYLKCNEVAIRLSSSFIPIIRMAILGGFLATFLLGAHQVFGGHLKVGEYGVLVFLTQRLLWPLTGLAQTVDLYERAMASTRRILNLLKQPVHIRGGEISQLASPLSVEFKNVSFSYQNKLPVLKNINLKIEAKQTTAFVGSTGSGKSSLIKLLLRFYEPQSGTLFVGDRNITEYSLQALREKIALVSQDVFLFSGTISENIAYGSKQTDFEQIKKAAELAECLDFIDKLPMGFDTIVGERGQKLSGGQKQRISIARAILKDPEILVLDEATSAVDNETEAAIQRSLNKITKGRTTIVVAHRLSTIVGAQRIYVLDNGEVKDYGTHSELISRIGLYQNLWGVQTGKNLFEKQIFK